MKARYNIAHVLPWASIGGTEHATLRIAKAVEGDSFKNIAFCPGGRTPVKSMFEAAGFETADYQAVEPSYRHPKDFLRASFQLAREFKRREIDLIHCSDMLAGYYTAIAGKIARLPVACHIRCVYENMSLRDRSFIYPVDKFIFVSRDAWRHFSHRVSRGRGTIVYDGIDVSESRANGEAGRSVRREFNIPENVKIIGMVARVAPAKDYATLVKAAARIVAVNSNIRFLIVGDHSQVVNNREHYKEVMRMLAEYGVAPYFIFTDHRDDVSRMISAMDIFVLSTHTEGLPLVILEAMAHAKPVVATAVGGVPEIVLDGRTGLLYPHQDDRRLATQLTSLLQTQGRADSFGQAGRQFVKANFTKERFAQNMANVYREMLCCEPLAAGNRSLNNSLGQLEGS